VAYPIRGTPYFEEVADRIVTTKAWADGSDRDFRIRSRHSRRFYQNADKLLRAEVELDNQLRSAPASDDSIVVVLRERIAQARDGLSETYAEPEA
jgi:anaerobic magnesium-protoporphyrin IX monomethyl ester cyclase